MLCSSDMVSYRVVDILESSPKTAEIDDLLGQQLSASYNVERRCVGDYHKRSDCSGGKLLG